jgi:hypothetical protein
MARTSNLANVATVSRASKAWYPGGWDFTNGGAITGDLTEYANNIARDGAQGLLVEEGSTNEIRNPRGEGAGAGTPGTLPTNWQVAPSSLQEIVGSGTENGWPYVDVRFNGTPTFDPAITPEADTQITASNGQTWTGSIGVKLVAGDLTNISGVRLVVLGRTSAGAADSGTFNQSELFTPDGTHKRIHHTATLDGGASTERVISRLVVDWDGSGAIDITLRIYAPQLEQKAYPTSPILPPAGTLAASTRAADDIEVGNGAWSNDNGPGSIYIEAIAAFSGVAGNFGRYAAYGNNNGANELSLTQQQTSSARASVRDSSVAIASVDKVVAAGDLIRGAMSYDASGATVSVNAETQQTSTGGDGQLGTSKLAIGRSPDGAGATVIPTAYIKQIRYWPRRLSNAELEALVGN